MNSNLLKLPELEYGSHLIEFLYELGIYTVSGFGILPLSFSEIEAWKNTTKTNISSWEARVLKFLSSSYVSQHNASEDPNCPAPYSEEIEMLNSSMSVVEKFKMLVAMRKGKK